MVRLKKWLAFFVTIAMLLSVFCVGVSASDSEFASTGTYLDKDFVLSDNVLVDENFSANTFPTGGIGFKWENKECTLVDSCLNVTSGQMATLTLDNEIVYDGTAGANNKYVLSFDMKFVSTPGKLQYMMRLNGTGNKPISAGDNTNQSSYYLSTTNNSKFANNLSFNSWYTVKYIMTIGETSINTTTEIYSADGSMVSSASDSVSQSNISSFLFVVENDAVFQFDNVKFYEYPDKSAITEPDIPGVQLPASASSYILDESFDDISAYTSNATDSKNNAWGFQGSVSKKMEIVDMTSGRKVMKISSAVSPYFTITPENSISYNSAAGANNTYVLKFGINLTKGSKALSFLDFYYNTSSKVNLINIQPDGRFRNSNNDSYTTTNGEWYTVAAVFTLGNESTTTKMYLLDGNTVKAYSEYVLDDVNSLHHLQFSISEGDIIYLDNLQLYTAGSEIAAAAKPEISVSNIKLGTVSDGEEVSGEVTLSNVAANTPVYCSADFTMTNKKPVAYSPIGIFAAYEKQADDSLKLVNTVIVDLSTATDSDSQTQSYVSASDSPLFTSSSDGSGKYAVKLMVWTDLARLVPINDAEIIE